MNNYDKKKSNFFDTKKQPDIEPSLRDIVYKFAHQRRSEHILNWYLSRKQKMKNFTPEQFNKMEELINNPETSLIDNPTLDLNTWVKYLDILEESKSMLDETSYIKEKKNYEEIIEEMQERLNTFNYNMLFKFHKAVFEEGISIVLGGVGSGKSNLVLKMALDVMQSGNYELITNLGIEKDALDKYNDIHYVTSFKDLLLIVAENQINNLKFEKKGQFHKVKNMICIIDEGEQLFQASKGGGDEKEIDSFNLLAQFFRKLNMHVCLVFHSFMDLPAKIRRNPSIVVKIFKNMSPDGEPMDLGKDKAIFEFPKYRRTIVIEGIEKEEILKSKHQSVFILEDFDNYPEKSVNMKYLLRLGLDNDGESLPKRIITELQRERVEYWSEDKLIHEIERIERISREYKVFIDKKTDYLQYIISEFEKEFRLTSVNNVKGLRDKIKSIVNRNWVIESLEEKIKEKKKEENFNYKICNKEDLFNYLNKTKLKDILKLVNEDFRIFNLNEYVYLREKGISSNKIRNLYGQVKEIVQKQKKQI